MADYHSLLSRAVANLPSTSPPAKRQAIYDSARKALLTQLRSLRPPLPEGDITREETALDAAIAQVEARFVAPDAAHEAPAQPESQPGASPPTGPAHVRPTAPLETAGSAASGRPAASTQGAPAPARPPIQPPRTQSPAAASAAGAGPSAARTAQTGSIPRPPLSATAPKSQPGAGVKSPAAPAVTAKSESSPGATQANLANVVPAAKADAAAASAAPPVVASRAEGALELAGAPEVPSDFERVASAPRPDSEAQRPVAPGSAAGASRSWLWLALAVVVGVVISVAVAAIVMRQKPQDLAINPPAAEPQEAPLPQAPAKIAERAQPAPANQAPPAAASEPHGEQQPAAQGAAPAGQAGEAQNSPAALPPVAARAAMLIASPDDPQKPVVNLGSTVWSTIPPLPGQPATVAVKADADIPDLKMHATMTIRKNTDPTLQATHTIDLKFSFAEGAPITGFKDVGLPQMRKVDSTASETLTSVKVKISDVYFLIALAKDEQDTVRNLDLMQTRAWFDFPLLLNDNRIAKIVFQKSPEGEAMLAKAFEAWK
jgi:hypothetical protein